MTATLALKPPVSTNVVFLDGITRTGKLLTSKLLSSLQRVDYFMHSPILEHIPTLWRFGVLQRNAAACILRMNIDVLIYDRMVGRNLNSRWSDASYVGRAADYPSYVRRSTAPEGPSAVDAFNAAGRMALFLTHELLPSADLVFEAVPYLKLIEIERHPVDVIHSWWRRGWGERFGKDPLAFTPVATTGGTEIPWFAMHISDTYATMSPMERCAEGVLKLIDTGAAALSALDGAIRKRILFLSYETIVRQPAEAMAEVAVFLETEPHDTLAATIAAEKLPRPERLTSRSAKEQEIRSMISAGCFERLQLAAQAYEARHSQKQP